MFKNWVSSTSLIFMITVLVLGMLCCVVASEPEDHRQEQQRGHDQILYKSGMMIRIITKMITLAVLAWFNIYYQRLLLDEAPEEERDQEAEQKGHIMIMVVAECAFNGSKNASGFSRTGFPQQVLVLVVPRCVLASEPEDRREQQRGHDHILYKNGMMIIIIKMILLSVAAWFAIYYQSLLLGQAPQEETEQEPEQEEAHNDNGVLVPRCVLASEPEDLREQQLGHDHILYKNGKMIMKMILLAIVAVFALYYQIQLYQRQRRGAQDLHGGINNNNNHPDEGHGAEDLHGGINNNHPDEGNNAGNFAAQVAAQNDQEGLDRG
ncbi:Hypothetical predicted protein [Prunus dulcis]|uniref:Uncharacterized protein n=1 Tax=Prunus dulcis TaxID=3755 RepID=A0A5E4ETN7_PRUDU|nr:Hypothetical predicted protein [Prunus dulcis]